MELVWVFWVIAIAVSFGCFEAYALKTNKQTLSRTVWNATAAWPPLGVVFGILVGGLGIHFFWPCEGCPIGVSLLDMMRADPWGPLH